MRGYANEEQWLSNQQRLSVACVQKRRDTDAHFAHPFLLESLIMIVIRVALIHHCQRKRGRKGTETVGWRRRRWQALKLTSESVFAPNSSNLRRLSSMWMSQFPFESIKGQVYIALCQHKVEHLFQLNSGSATSRLELAYSGFANAIRANARLPRHWKQLQRQQQTGYLFKLI